MATKMTTKLQQQQLEKNRRKDDQLTDNERRLKSDNIWAANVESEWRVDNKRSLKARQQMDNELDMHQSLEYAARDRHLRQQQAEQEEQLGKELEKRKTEQLRDEKTRQRIRNDSQEIRDLEAKLKAAYTNKERFTQMAEKAAARQEEKKSDQEVARLLKEYHEREEENERARQVARYKENVRYQQELEGQLEDQERMKQDAYRESVKEKLMVDEIVRKIYEEDRQAAEREVEKQKTTKKYMDDFKAARQDWKRQEKGKLEEENRQLKAYAKLQDDREALLRQQKQEDDGRAKHVHSLLSEQLHRQAAERSELEQARLELGQEEQEALYRYQCNTEAERQRQAKRDLQRAHEEYLYLRERRLQEEQEEERRFRQEVLAKMAEDDRLEQLSAHQRRLKQQQHQRALQKLMEERRAQFAAERELEAKEREEEMKEESQRLAVVAEERQRLLQEHASRLLGYLPKGVIEGEEDLDLLGQEFRQAYHRGQLDPFLLHEQIYVPSHTDFRLETTASRLFQECWNMCEGLYIEPVVFGPMCSRKYCPPGCQTACTFWNSSEEAPPGGSAVSWVFPEAVRTDTDFVHITMHWSRPLPHPPVSGPHPILYSLLMRENNGAWRVIGQTYNESFSMQHDETTFVPEFLIQAIDDTGVIASSLFHVSQMIFSNVIQPVDVGALEGSRAMEKHLQEKNTVNFTHTLTYDPTSGLEARLTWLHPRGVSARGLVDYEVLCILMECGVYEHLPKCSYTDDLYESLVPVKRTEQPHFRLDQLYFNTRYVVSVHVANAAPHAQLVRVVIDTLPCAVPSADFRFCPALDDVATSPLNVTSGNSITEPPALTELIRDVIIELIPPPPPQEKGLVGGEGEAAQVLVNVSWTYISDPHNVNFSLTFFCYDDGSLLAETVEVTGVTYFLTPLLDNTLYEVVIELVAPPESGGPADKAYSDRGRYYLQDSRQRRQFNTSQLQLATQEGPQAVRMNEKKERELNGVIIGVTCVSAVVVLTLMGVLLYKKGHSFKDIIVPKPTVAKSNSYKSSVGGKTDYSNQLMVLCDEWEVDPQQLQFSTPLGQGAFGKVLTGYFSHHKVAIKLVKEGAPMSYKEDLVAEINLMKRLGKHPNIVCLVGACTVTDPIALVMEYVPFGNLQNFLKRCRLEGDLQKRGNGPSEIQYSMLEGCGGIENGVITPTDMLSFARQVSMAMEYLAEKKYVHRDLAARNVLLHHNKVVKVCDFGLSRDIFHDNQYKKLTNGKLPLKWMAIESLRDRVFTTQSDVWSFGILLWEIVTMGASPYPSIALADLYYVLSNHYRMDRPSNCSAELYAVMRACWAECPGERPTFTELRGQLEDLMAHDRDYLLLEDIDVPLSASETSSNPIAPDLFSGDLLPSQAARHVLSASSSESSSSASAAAGASASSGLLRAGPAAGARRPPMTIDVCIHQKSTERLMRPSESDSSP